MFYYSRGSCHYIGFSSAKAVLLKCTVTCKLSDCSNSFLIVFLWLSIQIAIGLVVALNYHNPFLSPYEEFQVN